MYVCIGRFEQLPDHGRRDLVRCNRRYVPGTSLLNIVTVMEFFYLCNLFSQGSETAETSRTAGPQVYGTAPKFTRRPPLQLLSQTN